MIELVLPASGEESFPDLRELASVEVGRCDGAGRRLRTSPVICGVSDSPLRKAPGHG